MAPIVSSATAASPPTVPRTATVGVSHSSAGAGARFWSELPQLLAVIVQFGLLVALVWRFQLEHSRSFVWVMGLAFFGFVIHHFLPARFRLHFFAAFSVGVTVYLMARGAGASMNWGPGLTLVGVGLGLIGLCHLPIAFGARLALLVAAGLVLSVLRARLDWLPWLGGIWPILGSMFAFRLMVYLYDLKHQAAPFSVSRAVAYFFMLPNVCFPLFPIVDYKTFCATYQNEPLPRIYQVGLQWMFRGVVQLLLYRLVYQFGGLDILDVQNATDAVRFMVATYLLYLKVSGQFHLIVGLLHMFGFNLPETHHLYYLASSFTDLWRRINIYWKDFIMKLFFYPSFFALKEWGTMKALAVSSLAAFFATWVLRVRRSPPTAWGCATGTTTG